MPRNVPCDSLRCVICYASVT